MWLHSITSKRTTVVRIRVLEIYDSELEHLTFSVSLERFVAGNKNSNKMPEVLRDERSHGCESRPVSDEDTTPFLPSVGISWRPIHFVIMDWIDIYRIHCRNRLASHTLCCRGLDGHLADSLSGFNFLTFLDIYRFIATVILTFLLHSTACVIIFGSLWAKVLLLFLFLYLAKCELQENLQSFYTFRVHCLNYRKSTAITWNF